MQLIRYVMRADPLPDDDSNLMWVEDGASNDEIDAED